MEVEFDTGDSDPQFAPGNVAPEVRCIIAGTGRGFLGATQGAEGWSGKPVNPQAAAGR